MKRVIWLLAVVFLLSGCKSLTKYSAACDFENARWSDGQNATFEFYPTNTLSSGEINISLRHNIALVDTTINLVVKTANPILNTIYADTVAITLQRGRGKRIPSTTLKYREGVVWQTVDKHTISISCLQEIEGVEGLSVEIDNAEY